MAEEGGIIENTQIIEEIADTIHGAAVVDFAFIYDSTPTRGIRLWFTRLKMRNSQGLPIALDTGGFCMADKEDLEEAGIALFIRGSRYSPSKSVPADLIDETIESDLVTLFHQARVTHLDGLRYGGFPCLEHEGLSFYPLKADAVQCATPEEILFSFRPEGFCRKNPVHRIKTWISLSALLMVDADGACAMVSEEFFSEYSMGT